MLDCSRESWLTADVAKNPNSVAVVGSPMLWGVLTQMNKDFNYLTIWIWISNIHHKPINLSLKPVRKPFFSPRENKEVIHQFVFSVSFWDRAFFFGENLQAFFLRRLSWRCRVWNVLRRRINNFLKTLARRSRSSWKMGGIIWMGWLNPRVAPYIKSIWVYESTFSQPHWPSVV